MADQLSQRFQPRIFRTKALHDYMKASEGSVIPRLVSPRTFVFAWILFAILIATGVTVWRTRIPVYATGIVVVVKGDGAQATGDREVAMVLLVPPETLARLKTGQKVILSRSSGKQHLTGSVTVVEREILSPQAAGQRFSLSVGAASQIREPVGAAFVCWTEPISGLPPSAQMGSFYEASVEISSRPVISILPVLGRMFSRPTNS
jgi:hypothetical protein